MRKKYEAKDKNVNRMGRDGLLSENLHSGETVRISRRETDSPANGGDSAEQHFAVDVPKSGKKRRKRRAHGTKTAGRNLENGGAARIVSDRITGINNSGNTGSGQKSPGASRQWERQGRSRTASSGKRWKPAGRRVC